MPSDSIKYSQGGQPMALVRRAEKNTSFIRNLVNDAWHKRDKVHTSYGRISKRLTDPEEGQHCQDASNQRKYARRTTTHHTTPRTPTSELRNHQRCGATNQGPSTRRARPPPTRPHHHHTTTHHLRPQPACHTLHKLNSQKDVRSTPVHRGKQSSKREV